MKTHRTSGFFVVIVGPDGCGKSTVSRAISIESNAKSVVNFRPRRVARGRKTTDHETATFAQPHALTAQCRVRTWIKFLAIFADLLTSWIDVLRARRHKDLLIYERYAYDLIVDPVRTGLQGIPEWARKACLRFLPEPDLVVALVGDANVIQSRKPELSAVEVERQVEFWRQNEISATKQICIDSTQETAESLSRMILGEIDLRRC